MRIIRTEMYFNARKGRHSEKRSPNKNICFAWIKDGVLDTESFPNDFADGVREVSIRELPFLIDTVIDDKDYSRIERDDYRIVNSEIIESILNDDIVIENSPPQGFNVKELLNQTNTIVVVGSSIGSAAAVGVGMPFLVIFTIPAGMIVVGTALGVSSGLANGLDRWIRRKFDGPDSRPNP
jgi:hypothetical protein